MEWVRDVVAAWRSGTQRSQTTILAVMVVGVLLSFLVSMAEYGRFPLAGYFLWLLVGLVLLRFRPLLVLTAVVVVCAVSVQMSVGNTNVRISAMVVLTLYVALVLFVAGKQRSGLPGPLSEALLADLRDRLDAQGRIPPLPAGWDAQTAMIGAHGVGYAGDFMVADVSEEGCLDVVLVDVVGKGVAAGPSALLFAGAMGGLVGALRGERLMDAANEFLLRQESDETFATAVHLSVDLGDGSYRILSAGHPPALRWEPDTADWKVDGSRGLALGVMAHPELEAGEGVLPPGGALLFYTDGVVEQRGVDIDDGISWLRSTAAAAVAEGFDGAARRIVREVPRGDDDRAVLILSRRSTGA